MRFKRVFYSRSRLKGKGTQDHSLTVQGSSAALIAVLLTEESDGKTGLRWHENSWSVVRRIQMPALLGHQAANPCQGIFLETEMDKSGARQIDGRDGSFMIRSVGESRGGRAASERIESGV